MLTDATKRGRCTALACPEIRARGGLDLGGDLTEAGVPGGRQRAVSRPAVPEVPAAGSRAAPIELTAARTPAARPADPSAARERSERVARLMQDLPLDPPATAAELRLAQRLRQLRR